MHQEFHKAGPDLSLFTLLPSLLPSSPGPLATAQLSRYLSILCPDWVLHPQLRVEQLSPQLPSLY